jgi:hypothetical protein
MRGLEGTTDRQHGHKVWETFLSRAEWAQSLLAKVEELAVRSRTGGCKPKPPKIPPGYGNGSITPEVFESIGCQLGVAGGVLETRLNKEAVDGYRLADYAHTGYAEKPLEFAPSTVSKS